jgi:hypothetical protein
VFDSRLLTVSISESGEHSLVLYKNNNKLWMELFVRIFPGQILNIDLTRDLIAVVFVDHVGVLTLNTIHINETAATNRQTLYPVFNSVDSHDIHLALSRSYLSLTDSKQMVIYHLQHDTKLFTLQQTIQSRGEISLIIDEMVMTEKAIYLLNRQLMQYVIVENKDPPMFCVVLSLHDTFGDGWSENDFLLIEDPSRKLQYISLSCANPNPLQVRYCPTTDQLDNHSTNIFTFSLPKNMAVTEDNYSWEISWSVFEEFSERIIPAKRGSVIQFEWSIDSNALILINWADPPAKEQTRSRPPDKQNQLPSMKQISSRVQVQSHSIISRSIFSLAYHVFDVLRKQEVVAGTLTPDRHPDPNPDPDPVLHATTAYDRIALPDGDYIIRVTQDEHEMIEKMNTSHIKYSMMEWEFCNQIPQKVPMEMVFRISGHDCQVLTVETPADVCLKRAPSSMVDVVKILIDNHEDTNAADWEDFPIDNYTSFSASIEAILAQRGLQGIIQVSSNFLDNEATQNSLDKMLLPRSYGLITVKFIPSHGSSLIHYPMETWQRQLWEGVLQSAFPRALRKLDLKIRPLQSLELPKTMTGMI